MTPLRLYRLNDDLEYEEIYFHPYAMFWRYVACNIRAFAHWMLRQEFPHSDYLRIPPRPSRWRDWNIHARLTVRWQLKAKR